MTIFGESAGGMSVATLLGTPAARGLFHRAIPQSGAASNVSSAERAAAVAEKVMDHLGVDDVDGLRAVPAEALVGAQSAVRDEFGFGAGLPFQPVVDGTVLARSPLDAVRGGMSADIPLLTGSNAHEMRLFTMLDPRLRTSERAAVVDLVERHAPGRGEPLVAAYEAEVGADPARVMEAIMTDRVFRFPAIELLEAQAADNPETYAYEFRFESTAFGGGLGAAHAVEIPFSFDNLDAPGAAFFVGDPSDEMRRLATSMADAWVAFARHGAPASDDLPPWPRYEPGRRATMTLDLDPGIEEDPGGAVRRAWTAA